MQLEIPEAFAEIVSRQQALADGKPYYFTGKPCKRGHFAKRRTSNHECYECGLEGYKRRSHNAYLRNTEAYKKRAQAHYYNNHEAEKLKRKKWREENRDILRDYFRHKYHSDTNHRIGVACRRMLRRCLDYTGRGRKTSSFKELGYNQRQLKLSIQAKFKEGMSWENHGQWHIDHIRPIIDFVRNGIDDPAVINSLDNLQPLWAEENFRKNDAVRNS